MVTVNWLTITVTVFGIAIVVGRDPYAVIDVPTHTQLYGKAKATCHVFNARRVDAIRVFQFYRTYHNESRKELGEVTVSSSGKPEGTPHAEPVIAGRSTITVKTNDVAVLEIENITCVDEGEYGCDIGVGEPSALFMDVVAPPDTPELTWDPPNIYAEEMITFTCTADVGRPAGTLTIFVDNGTRSEVNTTTEITLSSNGCTYMGIATAALMLPANVSGTRVGCEVVDQDWLFMSLDPVGYTPDLEVFAARPWFAKAENFWIVVGIGIATILLLMLIIVAICTALRRKGYKSV